MANHLTADLDDMVFEDRERNYGAYFLRKRYPVNLSIAVGFVAFLALVGGFGPLLARNMGWITTKKEKIETTIKINLTDVPQPPAIDKPKELTPPPKPPIQELKQREYLIPDPVPVDEADPEDQTIEKIEDLIGENLGLTNQEGVDELPIFTGEIIDDGPKVIVDTDPDPTAFQVTEEEPQPVNIKDVTKLIGYPQVAQDAGIQGRVLLRVLVDKNGQYKKHLVTNAVHPILSEAVEKHISKLMFTPAIQGGRPIKFWVNIPFNFNIVN